MNKGPKRLSPAPHDAILHGFSPFFPFSGQHYGIICLNLKGMKRLAIQPTHISSPSLQSLESLAESPTKYIGELVRTDNYLDPQQRITYSCFVITLSFPLRRSK
jgi:hypothetical protein